MEETFLIMTNKPVQGFPKGHLFDNITIGIKYSIRSHYMKSRQITDDTGKDIWVSGKYMKKFFKEVK